MAHATKAADDHDASPLRLPLPPLQWPRPSPLLVILSLLTAASYLALTRLPALGRLTPAALLPIAARPHDARSHPAAPGESCAWFYAGAGPARALTASVTEFGAVGDGATRNTAAFRRAVAELHARADGGGARLEVPPGRWLTGSFNLTSRFTLFLHRGAVILGSQLDFKIQDGDIVPLVYGSQGEWDSSMKIILDWSPFSSKEELLQQCQDIGSHGTKVVVYNLWMNDDGLLELEFEDDEEVIQEDSSSARSVVGVLEANFIEPAHDKQDFERTALFIGLEANGRT